MFFKYEGYIIIVERQGEIVEAKLKVSKFDHYIIEWTNQKEQSFMGSIEDWEIEKAIKEKKIF